MMVARLSEMVHEWLGWCPNAPTIRTAPGVLVVVPENIHPAQPGDGGSAGSSGRRIRCGVNIAAGSLKTVLRDRQLLWFTALAGLVLFFLIAIEEWAVAHIQSTTPFLFVTTIGDSFQVVDTRLVLIEMICLSCFTLLLAGIVRYRDGTGANKLLTIREAFVGVTAYARPLAVLSVAMALVGTILYEVVNQSQFFGKIIMTISMAVFYLPYAYYLPDKISAAIFFSVIIMVVNILLFLIALYVVPIIVLEKKGLIPALLGSVSLMKKTLREMLGCFIVFGAIILGVATVALMIGQSPILLNHDYDFFISMSRGQLLMMTVCFLFLVACWALMAAGFTAAGIAITDLYAYGKTGNVPGKFEKT